MNIFKYTVFQDDKHLDFVEQQFFANKTTSSATLAFAVVTPSCVPANYFQLKSLFVYYVMDGFGEWY